MSSATFEVTDAPKASTQTGVVERMVDVHLSEADYNAVLSTRQDFGKVVNFLVSSYAQGGIMIQPSKVTYLTDVTGLPISSQTDIVEIVENVTKRNSAAGDLRVTVDVDPAFAPGLEEIAYAQGRTVNEIINESLNILLTNSWLHAIETSGGTIPLLKEQRNKIEKVIGCNITSESLTEYIVSTADKKAEKKLVQLEKKNV